MLHIVNPFVAQIKVPHGTFIPLGTLFVRQIEIYKYTNRILCR